jgi:uncharacterized protein (DUF488 family)
MYYRRKILLTLLQLFDNRLEKIQLQKLLFLFTQQQSKREYDFIPYKYGCYSYSANADLTVMVQKGILRETHQEFILNDSVDYWNSLKEEDKKSLQRIKSSFAKMNSCDLMKYTYVHYPYWATHSVTAKDILSPKEWKKVVESKSKSTQTILFTIGYEGISLETYLNCLIRKDIKVLVDVRNNPMSMKYGFNKNQLRQFCENLNIRYVHFPEVGIQANQRQVLNTQADYDNLFAYYRKTTLARTQDTQKEILNLLKQHQRIAMTCFEANINQCHRKHLAEAIAQLPGFDYELQHF